jgi:hypothetical protein
LLQEVLDVKLVALEQSLLDGCAKTATEHRIVVDNKINLLLVAVNLEDVGFIEVDSVIFQDDGSYKETLISGFYQECFC